MNYTQLDTDYKYRHLAKAIYDREMEYFHYDFDRINFEHIVANMSDGAFKDDLLKRIADVSEQMQNVLSVLGALWAQVDDQDAYVRAVEYVTREREHKDAEK